MNRRYVAILIFVLALLVAVPVLAGETQALTVTAFVQNQQCLSGDVVRVTLSATAETTSFIQGWVWDTNNDGNPDGGGRQSPTINANYPDEVLRTARVGARNLEGDIDTDAVTFVTLRCEN